MNDTVLQSSIVHDAVLDLLHDAKGMRPPQVYDAPERSGTIVWALEKLGLKDEQWPQSFTQEALSDHHQIVHCKVGFYAAMLKYLSRRFRSAANALWRTNERTSSNDLGPPTLPPGATKSASSWPPTSAKVCGCRWIKII